VEQNNINWAFDNNIYNFNEEVGDHFFSIKRSVEICWCWISKAGCWQTLNTFCDEINYPCKCLCVGYFRYYWESVCSTDKYWLDDYSALHY
jgi:hypothetical protein